MRKHKVAVVLFALPAEGGVRSVGRFLVTLLNNSDRYEASLILLASSSRDLASSRLLSPATWFQGPRIIEGIWEGIHFYHVGCALTELEFQRYRPRNVLTDLLNQYDLVQIVAGSPALALVARDCRSLVLLQVATFAHIERRSLLQKRSEIWRALMTRITYHYDHMALKYVQAAFVENSWMKDYLSRIMGSSRVILAPPGVDLAVFHPGTYREDSYILYVGRLDDPRKNVRMLLEAYIALHKMVTDAPRLVLAGSGSLPASDWRLIIDAGMADKIIVRHRVSTAELADVYREASLFVLPSNEEGFGIVVVEAMASGLPVIATRCGGPEIAVVHGVTGYLTPVGDPRAMAASMRDLLNNADLRRRMGQAGGQIAREKFSYEATGRTFLRVYDELLSGMQPSGFTHACSD